MGRWGADSPGDPQSDPERAGCPREHAPPGNDGDHRSAHRARWRPRPARGIGQRRRFPRGADGTHFRAVRHHQAARHGPRPRHRQEDRRRAPRQHRHREPSQPRRVGERAPASFPGGLAMAQILVVDDEVGIRELLSEILADEGHQVLVAENAGGARRLRDSQRPDLVLLDIWMPDTDGITLLKEWAASGQLTMPVVMMSGHATIETAVEATRIGALDFLEKPIALQRLLATVKRALRNPEATPAPQLTLAAIGRSGALADTKKRLAQLAQLAAPLMLRGERGMRADLFARLLVPNGAPFIAGAEMLAEPPSELLGKAGGGVLFLPDLTRLE